MRIDLPGCSFKNCRFSFDGNCTKKVEYERCEYRIAKGEIAEAEPVRHGKWIKFNDEFSKCSLCNYPTYTGWNQTDYCPNCGAKMRGI